MREFSIKNQVGLWFQKNTRSKVEVKCQWRCPFWMYASTISGNGDTLYIKTLRSKDNCAPFQTSHHLNSNRIATEVAKDLLVDEG